ncbi:MAG: asparagine--tRNA ligase [Patescibacteria group bacterium]
MNQARIAEIGSQVGQETTIRGWVFNVRSSGSIFFLQIRDGSGRIQAIVSKKEVSGETWEVCQRLTMESSVCLIGKVREDKRSPSGYELDVKDVSAYQVAEDFPIAKKDHGIEFLMDERHLWLRSPRQEAILRVRDEIIWQLRKFFKEQGFVMADTPILTPTSCEGTTTLFETEYFDTKAYLAQSGQLYSEAIVAALGKVYDFGPTFRAEKSKTRRHLMEFWMLDAEMAFVDNKASMRVQEEMVSYVIQNVMSERAADLAVLERDTKILAKTKTPFPRITYDEAVALLQKEGSSIKAGDDFGADEETIISSHYDRPVFITNYPKDIKAFYMQPDPKNHDRVLCSDLIAPEGYGEIIGGSQRIDDHDLLLQRMKEHKLPIKDFQWYLDLRKYGSFPHSGFGLGLERLVAWICKLDHIREAIPFPRLMNRLRP